MRVVANLAIAAEKAQRHAGVPQDVNTHLAVNALTAENRVALAAAAK